MVRFRLCRTALPPVVLGLCLACSEDIRLGENFGGSVALPPPDASAAASGAGNVAAGGAPGFPLDDAGTAPSPPVIPNPGVCEPVRCRGAMPQQCGNCMDDDGDGLVDANDPQCLGPCDDSEAELFSGTPTRVTGSCRADCYFDLNSGPGNDRCDWSYRCDEREPVAPMCSYDPSTTSCQMDEARASACQAGCLPLVPNGCDCFGCCELPANSGNFIWLGSELATSTNLELGRPCTPVPQCQNPCEECELCIGKPQLPASCGTGSSSPACPLGVTPCDPAQAGACGTTHYCITGCCVPLPR